MAFISPFIVTLTWLVVFFGLMVRKKNFTHLNVR